MSQDAVCGRKELCQLSVRCAAQEDAAILKVTRELRYSPQVTCSKSVNQVPMMFSALACVPEQTWHATVALRLAALQHTAAA